MRLGLALALFIACTSGAHATMVCDTGAALPAEPEWVNQAGHPIPSNSRGWKATLTLTYDYLGGEDRLSAITTGKAARQALTTEIAYPVPKADGDQKTPADEIVLELGPVFAIRPIDDRRIQYFIRSTRLPEAVSSAELAAAPCVHYWQKEGTIAVAGGGALGRGSAFSWKLVPARF